MHVVGRYIAMFIVLLITFFLVCFLQVIIASGFEGFFNNPQNIGIVYFIVLFFAWKTGLLAICYVLLAIAVANVFEPRWRKLAYSGLIVFGYAIFAIPFYYGNGRLPLARLNDALPFFCGSGYAVAVSTS